MWIAALYGITGEKLFPVLIQLCKGIKSLFLCMEFPDQIMGAVFSDHARFFPFVVSRVFTVAQKEYKRAFLAWLKCEVDLMDSSRIPSAGHGIAASAVTDCIRNCVAVAIAQEIITAGVITINWCIYGKEAVVISSLTVFCFVIDGASFDLYFTDA